MNPTGTYDVEWATVSTYISPDFGTGTGVVTVTALNPADPDADPSSTLGTVASGETGKCSAAAASAP